METLDMMILARNTGLTYISEDLAYNTKLGFHEAYTYSLWDAKAFDLINDIMELDWVLEDYDIYD